MKTVPSSIRFIVYFLLLFAGLFSHAIAQVDGSRFLEVYPPDRKALVGSQYRYQLSLPFRFNLSSSDVPVAGDGEIIGFSSSSSSSIRFNSQSRSLYTVSFTLTSENPGTVVVGPVEIAHQNQTYVIDAVEFEIVTVDEYGIERFELPELGEIAHPVAADASTMLTYTGEYFSTATVPDYVYEGQVFQLITHIYCKANSDVAGLSLGSNSFYPPDNTNPEILLLESYRFDTRNKSEPALDNEYLRFPIVGQTFMALRPGEVELRGTKMEMGRSRSFLFDKLFSLEVPSNTLEIRPLPDASKPVNARFVGNVQLATNFRTENAEVGSIIEVDLLISGEGYLKPIALKPTEDIPGLLFVDSSSEFSQPGNNTNVGKVPVISQKKFKIRYQVTEPGEIVIPPIEVAAFDPESEQYRYHKTPDHKFTATGSTAQAVSLLADPDSESELPVADGDEPVLPEEKITHGPLGLDEYQTANRGVSVYGRSSFLTTGYAVNSSILLGGFAYFILAGFILPSSWFQNRNARLSRSREIHHHLDLARKAASHHDADSFYQETERFLVMCFEDAYGFNLRGLDHDGLRTELNQHLDERDVDELMALREKLDTWRYAPDAGEQALHDEIELLERILGATEAGS